MVEWSEFQLSWRSFSQVGRFGVYIDRYPLSYVQLERLEAPAHGSAPWTLSRPSTVLLADQCIYTASTQSADTLWASEAFLEHAQSPTSGAVNLDGRTEHGTAIACGRESLIGSHDVEICAGCVRINGRGFFYRRERLKIEWRTIGGRRCKSLLEWRSSV